MTDSSSQEFDAFMGQILQTKVTEIDDQCFKSSNNDINKFHECRNSKMQKLRDFLSKIMQKSLHISTQFENCLKTGNQNECMQKSEPQLLKVLQQFSSTIQHI